MATLAHGAPSVEPFRFRRTPVRGCDRRKNRSSGGWRSVGDCGEEAAMRVPRLLDPVEEAALPAPAPSLLQRVEALEREVARLAEELARLLAGD
jgi:uncharacterized protein YceH (UPF0502 family)